MARSFGERDVVIVEVSPRDGLQNEKNTVPAETKVKLVDLLQQAGLREIEVTSFVSPRWVPQMADHAEVLGKALALRREGVGYSVLVPNLQGFEAAVAAGAREVAVFASASESFARRNTNCTIDESFRRFDPVFAAAAERGIAVRGYVSCVVNCPYEGAVAPDRAAQVAARLLAMGAFEISLGDTTGAGTPASVRRMLDAVSARVPVRDLAGHFHDTYGMAIANAYAAWQAGLRVFDASVAGLGGCPYAPGASGNAATEDLAYLFMGLGQATGIDLPSLAACGRWIAGELGREPASRVSRALAGRSAAAPL